MDIVDHRFMCRFGVLVLMRGEKISRGELRVKKPKIPPRYPVPRLKDFSIPDVDMYLEKVMYTKFAVFLLLRFRNLQRKFQSKQ